MNKPLDLLQGTLDMLILKAVTLGPLHGYGVLLRIQQISKGHLEIQQGSLYPALYRLSPGLDHWRVGRVGEQSQSEVLLPDCGRQAQATSRNR
jgi:PadR family transcriptional regulator, regulatory protein PadR